MTWKLCFGNKISTDYSKTRRDNYFMKGGDTASFQETRW